MRNSALILLLTTACSIPLYGQAKGGSPAGTGTTTPTTPTLPTTPSPTTTTPTTTTPSYPTMTRPLYVSGRVMTEDGTTPPSSVTIVRICNGVTRAMGYTDSKGNFSFDLNHADNAFQDASTPGLMGNGSDPTNTRASLDDPLSSMRGNNSSMGPGSNSNALMGCELRAQLAGYRSTAVQLAQRRSMDDPDVGTIFLHRMGQDEGSMVSMTSMLAPKDAKKAYEKGLDALKKKKTEDAKKEFEKAVTVYPKYAEAWYRLGALQLSEKNIEAARTSFGQAITADPKLVTPYVELAMLDARDGKWKETAESASKAIRLDPVDFPVAFYFDAVANYNLQNFEAAEKSARQLQKLDTQHRYPMADRILASLLAEKKDYPGAAQQMRNYLKFAGTAKDADEVRGQLQQLEKMISEQSATAQQGETPPKEQ
jgi:tetratricopeptide (TPR) repeat protein